MASVDKPSEFGEIYVQHSGFFEIGDKFSKVYWEGTGAQVQERLGYAINEASGSAGAFQQFNNGRYCYSNDQLRSRR